METLEKPSLSTEIREFGPGPGRVVQVSPQPGVSPNGGPPTLLSQFDRISGIVDRHLLREGAILFRGFDVLGEQPFQAFAAAFGDPLLEYRFGSTPRTDLGDGVYTSTEYPAHQVIPLHNEQSYTRAWPLRLWFHCVIPAEEGGETPIADSRIIYNRLDPALRSRFAEKRLCYSRNYGGGLDVPWQKVFGTDDRAAVEAYCRDNGVQCEWKPDGDLRTRQVVQAVADHPLTGEPLWFNQAHLFHVSNLDPVVQEALMSIAGDPWNLPRNVFYGDGTPLEASALDEIRGVLDACTIAFPWQAGDVLMLDNMLFAHARSTFKGKRKVLVAMARPVEEGRLA
nr:TauD/TfdA family dioxygenase [Azospirillum sp. 412522]